MRLVRAAADRLPSGDGSFDVVVSSFVLQLVPSRHRALREARRVLGPGGTVAIATWLAGGSFPADAAYDEALAAAGLEPRDGGGAHGEPRRRRRPRRTSGARASRACGARRGAVDHLFTPEGYLAFVTRFDDEDLFATLDPRRPRRPRGGPARAAARAPARRPAHAAADRVRDGTALGASLRVTRDAPDGDPRRAGAGRHGPPASALGRGLALGGLRGRSLGALLRDPVTSSSTRGARTRAMTSVGSAWIVTPSGATRSATVIVAS